MINIDSIIERETNLYIKTLLNTVDTKDVEIKMISAKGNVVESVLSIDEEIGIDLIILGAKATQSGKKYF